MGFPNDKDRGLLPFTPRFNYEGKYHCSAGVQLDWIGFYRARKYLCVVEAMNTMQSN